MMKKILTAFLAMLMMWSAVASAAEITLFKNASGAGWDIPISDSNPNGGFKQALEKDGLLKDEAFPTAVLANIAYNLARDQKLPAGQMDAQEFKKDFLVANSLPLEGVVTVDEFRRRGPAGQFVLPNLTARVADVKTEVPAAPVANAPVNGATSPASPDAKQAIAIANMESQVKALQKEVAKSGSNQKEVQVLTARLKEFGQQLKVLQDGQDGFAVKADITAANKALADFKTEVGDLAKLRAEVTGLQTGQTQFAVELEKLKQNPILAWGSWLLLAIGALFLLCFATIFLTRRASKAEVKAVATQVETKANMAEAKAKEAMEMVTEANATALSAKQKVEVVAAEVANIKKVGGYSKVQLPDDFDAVLATLTKQGDSHTFCVTVGDKSFLIGVESNGSGMVKVSGIKEVTKSVNPKNLEDVIYRAAKLDADGIHRIVGVSTEAHLKAA